MTNQTETPTEEIFAEIKAFEKLQEKYKQFGAWDTEPDGIFQKILSDAVKGKNPKLPRTGAQWELYSSSVNCEEAANALHDQALKIVRRIESAQIKDLNEIKRRVSAYCWRLG